MFRNQKAYAKCLSIMKETRKPKSTMQLQA